MPNTKTPITNVSAGRRLLLVTGLTTTRAAHIENTVKGKLNNVTPGWRDTSEGDVGSSLDADRLL